MPDIFISKDNQQNQEEENTPSLKEQPRGGLHTRDFLKREKSKKEKIIKSASIDSQQISQEKETIISSPIGPFSAFKVRPKGLHFHEQEENEHVLLVLRKHFVTNIGWMLFGALLLIIPPVFFYFFNLSDFFTNLSISTQAYFVLMYAYYLIVFCYMFVSYITWYYNASLITDIKVVDVHFQDILYHDVSMTKLNLIEDVNYVQSGFFGSLFGYGDVYLETAGKSVKFDFLSVPNPERVANLLENLIGGSASAE